MIKPRKWIAGKRVHSEKTLIVVGEEDAAERVFTRSQSKDASVVTRFQPRRYTAQESGEVQPYELVEEYFHLITYGAKNNTAPADLQSIRFKSR